MPTLVFVFGTLKEGFPNFPTNQGTKVPGRFKTQGTYPLYLIGDRYSPWMLNFPGTGHQVIGELYEVEPAVLADMDLLERVNEPDGYIRTQIAVRQEGPKDAAPIIAQVYLKSVQHFDSSQAKLGPLPEYLMEHALLYRSRAA